MTESTELRRALAENDDLREQLAGERAHTRAQVAAEWLPVIDNLDLALQQSDPDSANTAIAAIREQALAVLSRLGFHRVDDVGEAFDPSRHEAATVVDVPDVEPGTIVAVLRPGYAGDGVLLRPASVAVAREPA